MNKSNSEVPEVASVKSYCQADNIGKLALAMFYVPVQEWTDVYDKDTALKRGTLFPCLDKPFIGERVDEK